MSEQQQNIKQKFGKAVRRRRRDLDLSQEALAERAGVHRTYIANIERGEVNVSIENIEKIAEALELSIVELLSRCDLDQGIDRRV